MKVSHLTSVHSRYDVRIFLKMCTSLAKIKEYEVNLIVADGKGFEKNNSVNIYDAGSIKESRLSRMTRTVYHIYRKAVELNSDVFHLHDPELIPIGLLLRLRGKKVIFDSHEDFPKEFLSKPYVNKYLGKFLYHIIRILEKNASKKFDYIVTATPFLRDKFVSSNPKTIDINNYPIKSELANNTEWTNKKDEVCYIGGLTQIRGIQEIVKAIGYVNDARLNLAGNFNPVSFEMEIRSMEEWKKVNYFGYVDRFKVAEILSSSKAGLITSYPLINHLDALPVKMFEYMSAGIPVIVSNFPLLKGIIEDNRCGIAVDPMNPNEISEAITYIIQNQEEAIEMGKRGRVLVQSIYNWENEEKKLYEVYNHIL